jgi:hypothetical protein
MALLEFNMYEEVHQAEVTEFELEVLTVVLPLLEFKQVKSVGFFFLHFILFH